MDPSTEELIAALTRISRFINDQVETLNKNLALDETKNLEPIPFDAERALRGDKVVTRSGTPIIRVERCYKPDNPPLHDVFPLRAYYEIGPPDGVASALYTIKGKQHTWVIESNMDLFMAEPAPKTDKSIIKWARCYRKLMPDDSYHYWLGNLYSTSNKATVVGDEPGNAGYLYAIIPIEIPCWKP